jgi:hypothetical protein
MMRDTTIKALCEQRGITEGSFHSWRRELRYRDGRAHHASKMAGFWAATKNP